MLFVHARMRWFAIHAAAILPLGACLIPAGPADYYKSNSRPREHVVADQHTARPAGVEAEATPRPDTLPQTQQAQTIINIDARRQVGIFIGIDRYKWVPQLHNARRDARAVAQTLREDYGYDEIIEVYDEQATRARILDEVSRIVENLKGGETVFIYYSGHGEFDETLDRGYWIPVDARDRSEFIPNSEVADYIAAMDKAGAAHVFLVSDSCFSGSFLGVTKSTRAVRPVRARTGDHMRNYLEKLHASRTRVALTSGGNEPVLDGGADGHSVFAYHLLRYLRSPEYRGFTATEMVARLQRDISYNAEQTPRFGVIKFAGHEGGEFIFVRER